MNIVWMSWKDHAHPTAGGAEVVKSHLAKRLVEDGHKLIVLTVNYKSAKSTKEEHDGYTIIRVGNRYTLYIAAWLYFRKNLMGWPDLVIDEMNTVPFFARFYTKTRTILLAHQLSRQIWFYEIFFPLSLIGYLIEPLYLRLLSRSEAITVSQSSKQDLMKYGFKDKNIHIISEGLNLTPVNKLDMSKKAKKPTILCFSAIRGMKRTLHTVKAFEIAKASMPQLQLVVAGRPFGRYGKKVQDYIDKSPYKKDIAFHGGIDVKTKIRLMQQAHYIVVTSIKEGWGLIVSETNAHGTPAIVYNVDGLRDAVLNGKIGFICEPNVYELSKTIVEAFNPDLKYEELAKKALKFSQTLTWSNSYNDFLKAINMR